MNFLFKNLFNQELYRTEGHKIWFRILELFLIWKSIEYLWDWGIDIGRNEDVVLTLGLAHYFDMSIFYGNSSFVWLAGIATVALIFAFFRVQTKWMYGLAMLIFHLAYAARFTLGEIPHSMNLVGTSLFLLAFAEWIFPKDGHKKMAFALGLMFFFGGLGYSTAAISKLIATGISWIDGHHLWLWMSEKSIDMLSRHGEFQFNFLQVMSFEYWIVATIILVIGLLTEFFGFLMWIPKWRPFIVAMIISMHLGITMTMNIRFDNYVMQLILIGFPWWKALNKLDFKKVPAFLTKV